MGSNSAQSGTRPGRNQSALVGVRQNAGLPQARSGAHPACRIGRLPAARARARRIFFGRDARSKPTKSELEAALAKALGAKAVRMKLAGRKLKEMIDKQKTGEPTKHASSMVFPRSEFVPGFDKA
jgi:hypothetical protein